MALSCRGARHPWRPVSHDIWQRPASARRPVHRPAAEDVRVDVAHGLTCGGAGVEHNAVPVIRDALGHRDIASMGDQIAEQARIGGRQLGQVRIVSARDNKHVYGSLRIDIAECDCPVILGHYARRHVGDCNGAEQAVRHAGDLNVCRACNAPDIYGCTTSNP